MYIWLIWQTAHFVGSNNNFYISTMIYNVPYLASPQFSLLNNTPGTRGGPGGRDQMLAIKRKKTPENQFFSWQKKNWGENLFFKKKR